MLIKKIVVAVMVVASACFASAADKAPSLFGYWQNFDNPAQMPLRLTDIPNGYNVVIIAFADLAQDGSVSFTLQGPPYHETDSDEFKNDIQSLQAKGVKVLLSLGGQNAYYQINNVEQEQKFVTSLSALISEYNFDGVDYDFESGLNSQNESFLLDATKIIKQNAGENFLVTIAPETIDVWWQTLSYGKYTQLIQAGLVDFIQVQLYNSGCMTGSNPQYPACYSVGTEDFIVSQADSTIRALAEIPNVQQKYVLGLPATVSAAGSGYMDPMLIKKSLTCLQTGQECASYQPMQTYPNLNQVMTWDINWDAKNSYNFMQTIKG